ncbi:hypothetical protein OG21DRAFT_781574 [Imleria badia]|nr:hypothetical protein OG21DRAFT_781574 [Imleria badia]
MKSGLQPDNERPTSSRVLPGNGTPFVALHSTKPELSHPRVFAHIPMEWRHKNGPHSREAVFLRYPYAARCLDCCNMDSNRCL